MLSMHTGKRGLRLQSSSQPTTVLLPILWDELQQQIENKLLVNSMSITSTWEQCQVLLHSPGNWNKHWFYFLIGELNCGRVLKLLLIRLAVDWMTHCRFERIPAAAVQCGTSIFSLYFPCALFTLPIFFLQETCCGSSLLLLSLITCLTLCLIWKSLSETLPIQALAD